jgi:hypothetical protein
MKTITSLAYCTGTCTCRMYHIITTSLLLCTYLNIILIIYLLYFNIYYRHLFISIYLLLYLFDNLISSYLSIFSSMSSKHSLKRRKTWNTISSRQFKILIRNRRPNRRWIDTQSIRQTTATFEFCSTRHSTQQCT